jgi:hypothetical protein
MVVNLNIPFSSATLDSRFGTTRGSFIVRNSSQWALFPPAGGAGVLFCAGTGTDPFYATLATGSYGDVQCNNGVGFFQGSYNFNFQDGAALTISSTPTYMTAQPSSVGPVLFISSEDPYTSGSTPFRIDTIDYVTLFSVNDYGEITLNGASGLAFPGNIQGVSYINGISNFNAQGGYGDVQWSDGSGGYGADPGAFTYDNGSQTLTTPNLTVNNTFNFLGQIPIASGGTAAPDADTAHYNLISGASIFGMQAPVPGTDKYLAYFNQSYSAAGKIQFSELFGYNSISPVGRMGPINSKTVANTGVFSTGVDCMITGAIVRVNAASAITVGPSAGFGNAAGTNNIMASQAMTALLTTADTHAYVVSGASKKLAAGQTIYFNLGTAATGTSQTITVDVFGYYVI